MNIEEIKNELGDAVSILSTLSVSGDAVEAMAAAKAKIRRAAQMLSREAGNG